MDLRVLFLIIKKMSKAKKTYIVFSLIFAIAAIMTSILLSVIPVKAAPVPDTPQAPVVDTPTLDQEQTSEIVDARDDAINGLSIIYNNEEGKMSSTIQILLVLTVLSLAPSILIMMTSFTRIIVVLHFVRAALGTQTAPPNQVLVGLALFLTLMIMFPVFTQIRQEAIIPYDEGQITQEEAFAAAMEPIREFMYKQTETKDVNLFCEIAGETYETIEEIPNNILIPSFILSELRTSFIIGFLIYIPFIVIDMVVSSVLMSMGMMMLPPTTISMPFKILLFILADGWNLVIGNVVKTFY